MFLKLICAILVIPYLSADAVARVANCRFSEHQVFGYSCQIADLEFNTGDTLQISGMHLAGRNDMSVTFLEIVNSSVSIVPQHIFVQFGNLQRFHAQNVGLSDLVPLRNCQNLQTIFLSQNQLTLIRNDVFGDCRNLMTIHLQNNQIATIERWAFRGLSSIETIQLNNNQLAVINADLFTENPLLKDIGLSNNHLTTINSRQFTPTPYLETLRLANNEIVILNVNVLQNLTRLETLLLNGNQFDNFQANFFRHLPNLKMLNINDNQLTLIRALQFDSNPRLTTLTMANNFLTEFNVNTFVNSPLLEALDIGGNQFERLPGTLLRGNGRLQSLGLRRCGINAIEPNFFNNLTNLRVVNLQTNLCVNRFFSIFRPFEVDVAPYLDLCFRNF